MPLAHGGVALYNHPMPPSILPLSPAVLDWDERGNPVSATHGDVYFSREGGLAETRHVFLDGNGLPERWLGRDVFTIGETGFGTGLNFLSVWKLFLETAPAQARLNFLSVEKHPLALPDMQRAHGLFPELALYAKALQASLPPLIPGYHRRHFAGGRIQLTLMQGDALEMFRDQDAVVDAWFLDGFAPRLNPELWQAELTHELHRLSAPDATFATFSTATMTMEALGSAGFTLEKRSGFGKKKYMLAGRLDGAARVHSPIREATIIGAGLAGAATAHALALRGVRVTVQDAAKKPASGASHNPSAILFPRFAVGYPAQAQFYAHGYAHSRALLDTCGDAVARSACGMLLFAKPHEAPERLRRLAETTPLPPDWLRWVDKDEATRIAGIPCHSDALWFPHSGWANLEDVSTHLLAHPAITLKLGDTLESVREVDMPTILCTSVGLGALLPELVPVLTIIRGQISCIPPQPALHGLNTILSSNTYITPPIDGLYHIGATFDRGRQDVTVDPASHAENIAKASVALAIPIPPDAACDGWAALRSTSRDRLPLSGNWPSNGLVWLNAAHGSRGLVSAPIAAELLASQLCGDPLPLPRSVATLLRPSRFIG